MESSYISNNLHFNAVQQRILAADCKEMHNVIGRGGGKSFVLAKYQARNAHSMPRSTRLFLGPSYRKMMTDLLPNITAAWERFGYVRDEHYVIGKSDVPKKRGWKDPIFAPEKQYREFMIHWHTGAALRIGSADRKVSLNGLNLDGIDADEVKLIDEDIFNEIIKVNRANQDKPWSHLPEHNSIITFTDKYWTRPKANWIMKKKALCDQTKLKTIYQLQLALDKLSFLTPTGTVSYTNHELAGRYINLLNKLRNETIAFIEAATYVNIPAIHPSYILQMKRNMGEMEFRASILNHDLVRNDEKEYFYPLLDENIHGYIADDFGKLDNLEFNFSALSTTDCTFDTDIDKNLPIEISCDWGGNISCLVAFQEKANSLNALKSFYVKHPDGIKQLAEEFCLYYKPHKVKTLNFYYDPSGNNKQANSPETLAEEFARYLRSYGWSVTLMHVGYHNNPQYELRYELWKFILQHGKSHDTKFPYFFMNRNNCKEVFISMLDAGLRKYDKKLKKDKSSEKPGSGVPPEHATHFSDAVDYIVMMKYGHLLGDDIGIPLTLVG